MRILGQIISRLLWLAAVITAWIVVYALIVIRDVGEIGDFWATDRLVAYAVFVIAPAITFIPISRTLRIPLYDLEAITAWSTLAFVVTFINPGSNPPLAALLTLLVSLVMALATLFTLLSYAIGLRLFAQRSYRYDFVRARQEGYLISTFLVGCLLLRTLEVLTIINAALLGLIILLIEVFLLSRGTPLERSAQEPAA